MFLVHRIVNTPVSSNCFVLYDKSVNADCIIVDPGTKDNGALLAYVAEQDLVPSYIILTHEHFDHCWGVNDLVNKYHIPIICSELCAEAIKYEKRNCSVFYDNKEAFTIDKETITIEELDYNLQFGDSQIHFWHTPGHTDASICLSIGRSLFTGDTLIKDERTVTKLPTGSEKKLRESLSNLACLKGNGFVVYPGHGVSFLFDDYNQMASIKGSPFCK